MPVPRGGSGPSNRSQTWYRFPRCGSVRSPVSSQPCREPIGGVEQPGIAGFGGEQDQLTDGNDAAVVIGCSALDIAHLIGETKTLALDDSAARSTPDRFSTASGQGRRGTAGCRGAPQGRRGTAGCRGAPQGRRGTAGCRGAPQGRRGTAGCRGAPQGRG